MPSGAAAYNRVSPSAIQDAQRFVLFPNGMFALQFVRATSSISGPLSFSYAGWYSRTDAVLTFLFDASNTAGAWTAKGVLRGDSLVVEFNTVMQLADFEDGVYVQPPPEGDNIYLADPFGTGQPRRITSGGWPSWSAAGKRIAFHRGGQICVIDADGGNEACLGIGAFPTWSPDGRSIAFTNDQGIAVMNADGTNVRTLIRHDFRTDTYAPWDMGVAKPAWSPDGQYIAFEHLGDGDVQPAQIFVMKADGSDVRRLTESADGRRYAESDPAWSVEGPRVFFWSYGYGIASVAASGGVPLSLYMNFPAVAYGTRPAPSPTGAAVAFTFNDQTTRSSSVMIMPGGRSFANARETAWSPDGKWIAYVRFGE
jgi:Tol biopolymer transport system component